MTDDSNQIPPPVPAEAPDLKKAQRARTRKELEKEGRHWARVQLIVTGSLLLTQLIAWVVFLYGDFARSTALASSPFTIAVSIFVIVQAIRITVSVGRGGGTLTVALGTFVNAFSLLVLNFSEFYWSIGTVPNFGETDLSKLDAVYFALGTLTTAGTGSISAMSELSRLLVTVQLLLDIALTGFALAVAAARLSERSRPSESLEAMKAAMDSAKLTSEALAIVATVVGASKADAIPKPGAAADAGKADQSPAAGKADPTAVTRRDH